MKTILIAILLVLSINTAKSQLHGQAKIDSLLKELPEMKEDTNGVNLLKSLSYEYYRINPDEAIIYGEKGLKLAKEIGWELGVAKSYRTLGVVYSYGKYNHSKGLENFFNALKIFEELKDNYAIINTLNYIGRVYINLSELSNSLMYSQRSLRISKKLNYKRGMAISLTNIGIIFRAQSDYKKAIKSFNSSLIIFKELGDKSEIAQTLHYIGGIYSIQANYRKAIKYYLLSMKIIEKLEDNFKLTRILSVIGGMYQNLSNYPKALEYYFKELRVLESLKGINGNDVLMRGDMLMNKIAYSYYNIGTIYSIQSKYNDALMYYNKALKINEDLGDISGVASFLNKIGEVYLNQSNYQKALKSFERSLLIFEKRRYNLGIASSLGYIGLLYRKKLEFSKSLEYFEKSLKIFDELNSKPGVASNLMNIGGLYLTQAKDSIIEMSENKVQLLLNREVNINKAIDFSKKSIELYKEIGTTHEQSICLDNLSEAYQLKGDYLYALKYYKESKKLNDSIFSSKNQTKIANLEAKRENELKEKEIVILKKEKENQKLQRYAMFGGIAGLGIIIGLILIQRRKSEKLLLNVLPSKIAKRLKAKEHPIADHFDGASIIFIDIVGFTKLSSDADPKRVVSVLNDIFTIFDKLADKHGLEKIKTIGDAYMAVAGIPEIQADHSKRTAQMALDIKQEMKDFKTNDGTEIKFRIGIDCGAVVAGVIGEKKFIYDLWSDAVNTASRMESTGESGQIQITDNFKEELEKFEGNWNFTFRGEFEIKGKGLMKTYYLD